MISHQTDSNKSIEQYLAGLTGNICSGKSKAMEYFEQLGAHVVDTDKVVHELYQKNISLKYKLCKKFGPKIFNKKLEVDRKKLGNITLCDKSKMEELEKIVWPFVGKETRKKTKNKRGIIIFEAAMLYESGLDMKMNKNVLVISSEEQQIKRLMNRNNLSQGDALKRINLQMPQFEKVFKSNYVIFNNEGFDELRKNVERTWSSLNSDYLQKIIYLLQKNKAYKSIS